ncbi:MAG: hypothetical protein ACLUVC_09940 [Longibaculum sp.]
MEVYLEITYVINALMIFMTFELLCFLLNLKMTIKELFKYVLTYNISILFLFVDFFDGFLLLYDLLLTLFYFRRLTYIYYPLFLFIYISLLSFIDMMLPSSLIFQSVLLIEGFDFLSLFIISIMVICIFYFYISFCQQKIHGDELVDVCFLDKKCLGFIDSGNKVFYQGYPVIFITKELMGDYEKVGTIQIETALKQEEVDIMMMDEIEINHQTLHHVYVGVMSSSEYDCILNSQLLGGLL